MTNGVPGTRSFLGRLGVPQRIMLLTAALAAVAVALFVVVVRPLSGAPTAVALPWVLWALAFALSEAFPVHVQVKRDAHTFSVSDLVMAAGLVLATPSDLVIAQVVGVGAALVLHRRQRGLKLAFNTALFALTGSIAVTVHAVLSAPLPTTWSWLTALVAVVAATLVGNVCIFGVMSISEGRSDAQALVAMCALTVPAAVAAAAVGLLVARTAVHDPAAVALLALPTIGIVVAYRAYTGAREQQENLRLLHEVTSLLHAGDTQAALGDFLDSVRSAFRAEMAELLLIGPDGPDSATVSRSRAGAEALVMAPLDGPEEHQRLLRLATASGTLTTRTGSGRSCDALDDYAAGHGLKDAVAAALRTEDRVHGLLLVGGRIGDVTTFTSRDLALLDTFARHVATSLERGRLEENLRQVTDLKEQLRHQALHDPLTGLPNRTLFLDRVRHAVSGAGRTQVFPAVLYLDLDGFKPVNDTYGHDAGDVLLRTVADRLRGCLRPSDTAARMGGDEFVVLLDGPIDRFGVSRVVERIRAQFEVPVLLGDDAVATVGASIGVALGDVDCDADTLVRHADVAMYAAKRSTGHDFLVYDPALGDSTSSRSDSTAELAHAIRNGELRTVYQPLIDLRTGRPIGAEALVRWQHPVDGLRPPDQFIALAEDSGLITQIGELVLNDACAQAARWVAECPEEADFLVTVNLSARQVADDRVVDQVTAALATSGLEPHRLVLEITETVLMHDREAAAARLWALKGLGVRIAIDDFGTGYSSLAYLRRFPLDMLKVAREFIDGLGRDAHDDVITRAILDLAGTLGLLTVAEGIETAQQSEMVAALGCDIAQGYLFSEPIEADAVRAVMAAAAVRRSPHALASRWSGPAGELASA